MDTSRLSIYQEERKMIKKKKDDKNSTMIIYFKTCGLWLKAKSD